MIAAFAVRLPLEGPVKGARNSKRKTIPRQQPGARYNLRPTELDNSSNRFATRHFSKAVVLLIRAGRQLDAASRTASDKYHADRLRFFAIGLRDVGSEPRQGGHFEP
jgi:hypothetical protein